MTVIGTLDTLLATIPGMTLGTNIISVEHPRLTAAKVLPNITVQEITDTGDYLLSGTRIYTVYRVQLMLAASTAAGLETLKGQVNAKLDFNHASWMLSYPVQYYTPGHESQPATYWQPGDWMIQY